MGIGKEINKLVKKIIKNKNVTRKNMLNFTDKNGHTLETSIYVKNGKSHMIVKRNGQTIINKKI